ncbi:MAG: hypothetical protein IJ371_02865 [Clostridia bacterium]|nr:hypothetical protein [Clostridia bacterium]
MTCTCKKKGFLHKLFHGTGTAIFTMFVWEIVEEMFENAIAFVITSATVFFAIKLASTIGIVIATQLIKCAIKLLFPMVKKLTYKEGNDKMEKLKKFGNWLTANKFTLLGIGDGILIALSGMGVVDVNCLPALVVGSVNLTPILYYVILGGLAIWASFFPESYAKFKARVDAYKAEKAEANIVKVAKKELANESKLANQTQAQQEKAKAKELALAEAKAEKEKAEKEYRAKIDAVKKTLTEASK